jgi:hypothetical protein
MIFFLSFFCDHSICLTATYRSYSSGVSEKLLTRVFVSWHMVYPEEALLLGVVSVHCHEDITSSVLSRVQGDCKVTTKRMAESKDKQN